jgi:hypothetical protein
MKSRGNTILKIAVVSIVFLFAFTGFHAMDYGTPNIDHNGSVIIQNLPRKNNSTISNSTISHSFTNITSKFESITGGYIDNDWTANSYFGDNGFITLGGDGLAFYENNQFIAPVQSLPGYLLSGAWNGNYFMVVGDSYWYSVGNNLQKNNGPIIGIYYPENNTLMSLDNLIPSYLVENTTFDQVVWNGSSFTILGEHSSNASDYYWNTIFYSYSPSTGILENTSNLLPSGFLNAHMTGMLNTPYGTFILLYSSYGDRLGLIENNRMINLTSVIPQGFTFNSGNAYGSPMAYDNGMLFISGNDFNGSIMAMIYNAETKQSYNLAGLFSGLSATIYNVAYSEGLFILYGVTNENQEFLYRVNPITDQIYDLDSYIPPDFASNALFNTVAAQGITIYITGGSIGNIYYGLLNLTVSYKVSFIENNLPDGTTWYVNSSGLSFHASAPSNISFNLANGTYVFSVTNLSNYYTTTYNFTITIMGKNIAETVVYYHWAYITGTLSPGNVIFSLGLSTLTINGRTVPISSSGAFNVSVTNGTYYVIVSLYGYETYYDNFTLNSGSVKNLVITLRPISEPLTISVKEIYAIIGAFVAIVVIVGTVWYIKRR